MVGTGRCFPLLKSEARYSRSIPGPALSPTKPERSHIAEWRVVRVSRRRWLPGVYARQLLAIAQYLPRPAVLAIWKCHAERQGIALVDPGMGRAEGVQAGDVARVSSRAATFAHRLDREALKVSAREQAAEGVRDDVNGPVTSRLVNDRDSIGQIVRNVLEAGIGSPGKLEYGEAARRT